MKIYSNIKFYRKKNRLTQAGLAAKLKTSRDNVASWENRVYPPIPKALKLAKALKVTLNDLFYSRP